MNKRITFLSPFLALVLLFCASNILRAQPISKVNGNNVGQFLAEMDAYFGPIMTVSTTEINQLLQPFINNGTHPNCADPSPSVYSQDEQQITFRWSGTPGNEYQLAYLNLLSGEQGTTTTDQISHSFGIDDGLYLFVFQQLCGTGNRRSNAVIIILDKVVALEVNPTMSCDCTPTASLVGPEAEGVPLDEYVEVDVAIRNIFNEYDEPFKMHLQRTCLNCSDYFVNPFCVDDEAVDFVYNVGYVEIGESNENVITFTDETLALTTNLLDGYELVIDLCKQSSPHFPNNQNPAFGITPSVPGSVYKILVPKPTQSRQELTLVNQAGQILYQYELDKGHYPVEELIDLSNYPSGMYFLHLSGEESPQIRKLLRY